MQLFLNPERTLRDREATTIVRRKSGNQRVKVLTSETLHIAQTIASRTNPMDLTAEITGDEVAAATGKSRTQVVRTLTRLRALGWCETHNTGRSTVVHWTRGVLVAPVGQTASDRLVGLGPRMAVM